NDRLGFLGFYKDTSMIHAQSVTNRHGDNMAKYRPNLELTTRAAFAGQQPRKTSSCPQHHAPANSGGQRLDQRFSACGMPST
ncbi:hypothetical protein, partial [Roseovarius sp.]|uniref:hypothetical protein n=1 Tax=Roseovarius sp. TaxID=1486281 RepID=UPI003A97DCCA